MTRASVATDQSKPSDLIIRQKVETMLALTDGPLAALPGPNLIHQMNAFCATNLTPAEYERFHGTLIWKRNDPQLAALIPLTWLSEGEIDAWFMAAAAVQ